MSDYRDDLIGNHESLGTLRRLIDKVAQSAVRTVLIYGETGTGKGLVARMIHARSARAAEQFMDINCAAIPGSLLESELFGHEKGAFTGAVERKIGLIEAANRGTVFLDEIREMDLTLQTKLLSLLDTQRFRRVGAVRPVAVDVRFIATTNKILLSEVKAGHFREDLYYRLQVVALNIPALRERGSDILFLADHFIKKFNKIHSRQITGLAPQTRNIFLAYSWPGNVRELENLIERVMILEEGDEILPSHLPERILRDVGALRRPSPIAAPMADALTAAAPPPGGPAIPPTFTDPEALTEANADRVSGGPLPPYEPGGLHELTANYQRRLIEAALTRSNGNLQRAAALLKLSRHALRHQMSKLGFPR